METHESHRLTSWETNSELGKPLSQAIALELMGRAIALPAWEVKVILVKQYRLIGSKC